MPDDFGPEGNQQGKYYDHYAKVLGAPEQQQADKRKRNLMLGMGALAAVILIGGGGYIASQAGSDDSATKTSTSSTSSSSSSESAGSTSTGTNGTTGASSGAAASDAGANPTVIAGWPVVKGEAADYATYQAPPAWKNVSTVVWGKQGDQGYNSPNLIGIHSATATGLGSCATNAEVPTAAAGFRAQTDDPPSEAARSTAVQFAKAIGTKADGSAGAAAGTPEMSTVQTNSGSAQLAKLTAVNGAPGTKDCHAAKSDIFVVAFKAHSKTSVWMLVRDAGGKDVPTDQVVQQMISSINPQL